MKRWICVLILLFFVCSIYSQNLHTQANAASINNEANATTGWTGNGNITSSSADAFSGNFSLSVTRTAANGREMRYTFNAVVGTVYNISIWARRADSNFQPAFANWSGFSGFATTVITSNNWTEYTWSLSATATSPVIRVYATPSSGGSVGNGALIDNVSIVAQSSGGGGGDTGGGGTGSGEAYTDQNANLSTVDWRARDMFVFRNLGVGTTNTQGYRLAVAGNVIAESVKVELQGTWPDYVFFSNYNLMSLSDLEYYINKNGHLPNVPTSREVEMGSLDLGEMNRILLEKIEELTLYVLQLNKVVLGKQNQIDLLDKQLKAQDQRLNSLELANEE
ncbi:hypothetical protein [Formosa sp. S-31]|uniref:hypothetical protein n=1 Tax=Formosa sp. S-31 TaxID=2790949 RepID=UPI003EBDD002